MSLRVHGFLAPVTSFNYRGIYRKNSEYTVRIVSICYSRSGNAKVYPKQSIVVVRLFTAHYQIDNGLDFLIN